MSDNEYNKFIKDRQKEGKPLPAGETLKKDAEALKKEGEAKVESEATKPESEAVTVEAEAKPETAPAASAPSATGSMLGDLTPAKD